MARIQLEDSAPENMIQDIIKQMNSDLEDVNKGIKQENNTDVDVADHMFAYIQGGSSGIIQVELNKSEERPANPKELEMRWREKVGDIAGTKELSFKSTMSMGSSAPISVNLQGRSVNSVESAAEELFQHLRSMDCLLYTSDAADE